MADASGGWLTRSGSKLSLSSRAREWIGGVALFGLGVLVVVLHQVLRLPLGLPGRQGVQWMALLIGARLVSRRKYATSLAGLGSAAASFVPFLGNADPLQAVTYFLPGVVIDLGFGLLPRLASSSWYLAGLAAIAHATKPLVREAAAFVVPYAHASLVSGLLYPLGTHLLFGFLGGLVGALAVTTARRVRKARVSPEA